MTNEGNFNFIYFFRIFFFISDVACSHSSSSSSEDSILQKKNFSSQNTFDSIEYQTESRIEVIRRNNYTDQYSSKLL